MYVRSHGTTKWYRHDYTKPELAVWTKRIAGSAPTRLRVWSYFNNDRDGYAIKNADAFRRLLDGP